MSLFDNFFEKQPHHRRNSQQEHAFGRAGLPLASRAQVTGLP